MAADTGAATTPARTSRTSSSGHVNPGSVAPQVEAVTDEYVYADRLFGEAAWWLRSSPFVPALLALGFATGFIHYVLDRAVFRFSSPDVRQAARGLLR